ncbi:MAG: hypothetical protein QXT45_05740 [Candidatus Bilamarchaeaceae archaeon]
MELFVRNGRVTVVPYVVSFIDEGGDTKYLTSYFASKRLMFRVDRVIAFAPVGGELLPGIMEKAGSDFHFKKVEISAVPQLYTVEGKSINFNVRRFIGPFSSAEMNISEMRRLAETEDWGNRIELSPNGRWTIQPTNNEARGVQFFCVGQGFGRYNNHECVILLGEWILKSAAGESLNLRDEILFIKPR